MKSRFAILLVTLTVGCAASRPISLNSLPSVAAPTSGQIVAANEYIEERLAHREGFRIIHGGDSLTRVEGIVYKLAQAVGLKGATFPVVIVDAGEQENALVVNDAVIVVYKQLLARAKSDHQLAAVLAHEVAHIAAKHEGVEHEGVVPPTVSDLSDYPTDVVAMAYAAESTFKLSSASSNMVDDLVEPYALQLEVEADRIGLAIMAKAGFEPRAALDFWRDVNVGEQRIRALQRLVAELSLNNTTPR